MYNLLFCKLQRVKTETLKPKKMKNGSRDILRPWLKSRELKGLKTEILRPKMETKTQEYQDSQNWVSRQLKTKTQVLITPSLVPCMWCSNSKSMVTDCRAGVHGTVVRLLTVCFCLDWKVATGWIGSDKYCGAGSMVNNYLIKQIQINWIRHENWR